MWWLGGMLCCLLVKHFANKIPHIYRDLDSMLMVSADVPQASTCPVLWNSFQLMEPEEVEQVLWSARLSDCPLRPCLAFKLLAGAFLKDVPLMSIFSRLMPPPPSNGGDMMTSLQLFLPPPIYLVKKKN